jgi:hypothetical protein
MKRTIWIGLVFLAVLLSGCNAERRRVSRETNSMTVKFEHLMKTGKTTRDQEQKFISAMKDVTFELDRSIRGTKKAQETRRTATVEAETGIKVDGPLNLD